MLTYLLFVIVLIYLFAALNYSKGDIFFPGTIVMLVYAFSLSFVLLEMSKWDGNISMETFLIFFIGLTVYLVGSIIGDNIISKISIHHNQYENIEEKQNSILNIPYMITFGVIIFDILVLFKYYIDVKHSASSVGSFSNISEMIAIYRMAGVYGNLKVGLTKYSVYGYSIMLVLAYMYIYIVVLNLLTRKRKKRWIVLNILPILLYIICSLMTGGRNPIIQMLVAALMMFYLLYRRLYGVTRKFNKKFTKKLIIIVAITLIGFSSMRGFVGRQEKTNTFDYIAMYVGAPIKLFDMFVQNPPDKPHIFWGQETFINALSWVGSYTHNSEMTSLVMNKEFRRYKNINLGNVYTAFREYYYDFGIVGVIILTFFHSIFFATIYKKINKRNNVNLKKFDLQVIIYSYLAVSLVYFSIDDRFYQKFFSKETFLHFAFMIILSGILSKFKTNDRYDE